MHIYHYAARQNQEFVDGLAYSNQQIFTDDEYLHLTDSLKKSAGFVKITILSLTYLGYRHE